MSELLQPGFVTLALAAIIAWSVLMCLRVVADAMAGAVARYDLRVEAARLRLEQSARLRELRARAEAGRARPRPHEPAPAAVAVDEAQAEHPPMSKAA